MGFLIPVTIVAVIVAAVLLAYLFLRPVVRNEKITGKVLIKGKFVAHSHKVKGSAQVVQKGSRNYLFVKDFYTIRGPDVFLVLSRDLKAKDKISLGYLPATKGSFVVEIPRGVDLTKYDKVLVWCRAFRVLFSYAKLK